MVYLAFILHMHQPYYKNLRTGEAELPWARLHGTKDYLDMALLLDEFPDVHQTFNIVPSLFEQLEDYAAGGLTDKFLRLTQKRATELTPDEKKFIRDNFFSADLNHIVAVHPRYYELFLKKHDDYDLSDQDYLDLQVWFNLSWIDPYFRSGLAELRALVKKGRYFSEEDKAVVVAKQFGILKEILPAYKRLQDEGKLEVSISPYFHPILPLLFSSFAARDANPHTPLPKLIFSQPQDAIWHVKESVRYYREHFGDAAVGMWPSEQALSMEILPMLAKAGLSWIVTDEAMLWNTVKKVHRDGRLLYRPYAVRSSNGPLTVLFRDKYLSDLIGFEYQHWRSKDAVDNFMYHILKIHEYFGDEDCLVTVALDGENAWEYYRNDGRDFLRALYQRLSESTYTRAVTVREYLRKHDVRHSLPAMATGSWIHGTLNKWMGHPAKNAAWECLAQARQLVTPEQLKDERIMKQIHILEGSDWFWWYGDKNAAFDELYRLHLKNFYHFIGKEPPQVLDQSLDPTEPY
ncbi:MAG: glycoside hydrolase family 57 protein [Candidatus Omnitrophica bacterium]|nr:glycoside hydrolase family 57 protein [Candidatus Omnitrophota bacterium]MDD5574460.1 glycoside hydrolase family 57 protein [Candidatus Omnitrophota bacterium]